MKLNFKKVATVLASGLMLGCTMGIAAAANYPSPFVSAAGGDVAIVIGSGVARTVDVVGASAIGISLQAELSDLTAGVGAAVTTGGVTENEVPLGGTIITGKIPANLTDSKVPALLDKKISWDDGFGSDEIDVHEEIQLSGMEVRTTLNDPDYDGAVLTCDKGLRLRYIFDDVINRTAVGTADADDLYLTILGVER